MVCSGTKNEHKFDGRLGNGDYQPDGTYEQKVVRKIYLESCAGRAQHLSHNEYLSLRLN